MSDPSPAATRAFCAVTASVLAVRFLLIERHVQLAMLQAVIPVHDHFFPAFLRLPAPLLVAAFAPMGTELLALIQPTVRHMRWQAVVETLSAAVLLLHQATYFYATWVVVFWAGTFLVWLAWRGIGNTKAAGETGPFLAQLLIAFFFLGGAAGKWTAGYWSGEPFYDLFFRNHPYVGYAALRARFDPDTVRMIATWYSRAIVLIETGMAFTIFLPARIAAVFTILAALGLWASSPDLFEVAWPMIGLAVASWMLAPSRARA